MTPDEDSQQSEELLGSEENCTAPVPSSSVQIRVRNVSELNNNNEAEASSSTTIPVKRRCLPSWMGSSNKKKKEENEQTPESTVTSPSTSKAQNENEVNNDDESSNQKNHINGETDDNSHFGNSGATEHDHKEDGKSTQNLKQQMEMASAKNDEAGKKAESTTAEADQTNESDINADTSAASTSNQTRASSMVPIKAEPNDDDSEAVGQVTAATPKDIKPAVKVEKEEATSSTERVSCRFGIRCYRRNPIHRQEEAHPGDTDYRRPDYPLPLGDVPACPYGDLCYRRNPTHFQEYTHPPSTDFKQNWKMQRMRLRDRKQNQLPKLDTDFNDDEEDFSVDSSEEFNFEDDDVDDEDDDDSDDDDYSNNQKITST